MISVNNLAFDFLRQHKEVKPETETLVMKKIKGKMSNSDLLQCFENGITGQYGKVYSLDPQTLIDWVDKFQRGKTSNKHYLDSGLLPVGTPSWEVVDWDKEANKCLTAFFNGVAEDNFHPAVYDRMMIDGKIQINDCMKYLKDGYSESDVTKAKQKVLRDVFGKYKAKGWSQVYFI